MNRQEHSDYVLYSIIWNATILSLKQKKYNYTKKVEIIAPRETPCLKASKDATKILVMPRPMLVENFKPSGGIQWGAISTVANGLPPAACIAGVYTDIYPRKASDEIYGNYPVLDNLKVRDITYDDKYENEPSINQKLAKILEDDYEIKEIRKNINEIKRLQQNVAKNPDAAVWTKIRVPGEKGQDYETQIRQMEAKITRRREKQAENLFKGYVREQRGMFGRFADEWHLAYHVEKACDFFFEQTGLEQFDVIIQRWAPRRGEMEVYACYFIVDTKEETYAPTDLDLL